ncbi:hypothetical protein L1987_23899 [Smallanthus sonchifolius]|uniref:Uncharacterized protein n=1 Tax=Smallanthus sonchifolius TaxID=185202 RepID=A0ACB9IIZ2_9ASTR|nr:hypothetical protein L1987_23899 [Smallanthus sonchifolius]
MESQLQRFVFKAHGSSSVDAAEKPIRNNFGLQQIRLSAADLFFSRRTTISLYFYRKRVKNIDHKNGKVTWKYKFRPVRAVHRIPLKKIPQDFLGNMKWWYVDVNIGEAMIEDKENKVIVCFYDAINLINFSKKDQRTLRKNEIMFTDEWKEQDCSTSECWRFVEDMECMQAADCRIIGRAHHEDRRLKIKLLSRGSLLGYSSKEQSPVLTPVPPVVTPTPSTLVPQSSAGPSKP